MASMLMFCVCILTLQTVISKDSVNSDIDRLAQGSNEIQHLNSALMRLEKAKRRIKDEIAVDRRDIMNLRNAQRNPTRHLHNKHGKNYQKRFPNKPYFLERYRSRENSFRKRQVENPRRQALNKGDCVDQQFQNEGKWVPCPMLLLNLPNMPHYKNRHQLCALPTTKCCHTCEKVAQESQSTQPKNSASPAQNKAGSKTAQTELYTDEKEIEENVRSTEAVHPTTTVMPEVQEHTVSTSEAVQPTTTVMPVVQEHKEPIFITLKAAHPTTTVMTEVQEHTVSTSEAVQPTTTVMPVVQEHKVSQAETVHPEPLTTHEQTNVKTEVKGHKVSHAKTVHPEPLTTHEQTNVKTEVTEHKVSHAETVHPEPLTTHEQTNVKTEVTEHKGSHAETVHPEQLETTVTTTEQTSVKTKVKKHKVSHAETLHPEPLKTTVTTTEQTSVKTKVKKHKDPCAVNHCKNGGTCRVDKRRKDNGGFECACALNFRGKFCHQVMENCDKLRCNSIKGCVVAPSGSVCLCSGALGGRMCHGAKESELAQVRMIVSKRTIRVGEIALGSIAVFALLISLCCCVHCKRVDKKRKKLRKKYKDALDEGNIPEVPPPDWFPVSNDVIKTCFRCCGVKSSLPSSYKPSKRKSQHKLPDKEDELAQLLNANTSIALKTAESALKKAGSSHLAPTKRPSKYGYNENAYIARPQPVPRHYRRSDARYVSEKDARGAELRKPVYRNQNALTGRHKSGISHSAENMSKLPHDGIGQKSLHDYENKMARKVNDHANTLKRGDEVLRIRGNSVTHLHTKDRIGNMDRRRTLIDPHIIDGNKRLNYIQRGKRSINYRPDKGSTYHGSYAASYVPKGTYSSGFELVRENINMNMNDDSLFEKEGRLLFFRNNDTHNSVTQTALLGADTFKRQNINKNALSNDATMVKSTSKSNETGIGKNGLNDNEDINNIEDNGEYNFAEHNNIEDNGEYNFAEHNNIEDNGEYNFAEHNNIEDNGEYNFAEHNNIEDNGEYNFAEHNNIEDNGEYNFAEHNNIEDNGEYNFAEHNNIEDNGEFNFAEQKNIEDNGEYNFVEHNNIEDNGKYNFAEHNNIEDNGEYNFTEHNNIEDNGEYNFAEHDPNMIPRTEETNLNMNENSFNAGLTYLHYPQSNYVHVSGVDESLCEECQKPPRQTGDTLENKQHPITDPIADLTRLSENVIGGMRDQGHWDVQARLYVRKKTLEDKKHPITDPSTDLTRLSENGIEGKRDKGHGDGEALLYERQTRDKEHGAGQALSYDRQTTAKDAIVALEEGVSDEQLTGIWRTTVTIPAREEHDDTIDKSGESLSSERMSDDSTLGDVKK